MTRWRLFGAGAALVAALAVAVLHGPLVPQFDAVAVGLGLVPLGLFGISLGGILKTAGGFLGLGGDDAKEDADAIRAAITEVKTTAEQKALAAEKALAEYKAEQARAEAERLRAQIAEQQRRAEEDKGPPWLLIAGGLAVVAFVMMRRT